MTCLLRVFLLRVQQLASCGPFYNTPLHFSSSWHRISFSPIHSQHLLPLSPPKVFCSYSFLLYLGLTQTTDTFSFFLSENTFILPKHISHSGFSSQLSQLKSYGRSNKREKWHNKREKAGKILRGLCEQNIHIYLQVFCSWSTEW